MKLHKAVMKRLAVAGFLGTMAMVNAQTATYPVKSETIVQQSAPETEALKKQHEADPQDTDVHVKLTTAYEDAVELKVALEAIKNLRTGIKNFFLHYSTRL